MASGKSEKWTPGMGWNPVEKVIMQRRSIRSFRNEPLPDALIQRVLEAGRFAPSAGNSQPWKFIVVNSPIIISEMERDAVRASKFFMWMLDYSRTEKRRRYLKPYTKLMIRLQPNDLHPVPFGLMQQIARDNARAFYGAPTLILLLEDVRGVANPSTDIGICGQNMVIAAHSLGLGTCWIGMVKILTYMSKWKKFFGIKYPYKLNNCIALGWPKGKFDGEVPREVQLVTWFDGGMHDPPKIVRQGE